MKTVKLCFRAHPIQAFLAKKLGGDDLNQYLATALVMENHARMKHIPSDVKEKWMTEYQEAKRNNESSKVG